jgi:hypothetical protein
MDRYPFSAAAGVPAGGVIAALAIDWDNNESEPFSATLGALSRNDTQQGGGTHLGGRHLLPVTLIQVRQ